MRHTMLVFLVIISAVFSGSVRAKEKEKTLKVIICAGQSNMVGKRSKVTELPKDLQGIQKNLFFDGESWVPLAPGKTEKEGFGPEISFAVELSKRLKEPVGIIKHSYGGTSLDKNWDPKGSKPLYPGLLKKVKAAQKSRNIEIVGMIWMQGESDARKKFMADKYKSNLVAFIQTVRKEFQSPDMIFVSGRINSPKSRFPYTDIVRTAQENCDVPRYGYIDCDSLEKGPDTVHYTTKGIVEMGRKFAETMMKLINEKK